LANAHKPGTSNERFINGKSAALRFHEIAHDCQAKPDTLYHQPVSLLDMLPTAVAAADGKLSADRDYDGVNLLPYLTDANSRAPHSDLFWWRQPLISVRGHAFHHRLDAGDGKSIAPVVPLVSNL
jgi:arylsulfatase A-like enzyme